MKAAATTNQILSTLVALVLASGAGVANSNAQLSQAVGGIAEITGHLERELPLAGEFSLTIKDPKGDIFEIKFGIKSVSLRDCRLVISRTEQPFYNRPELRPLPQGHKETVDPRKVDASVIRANELPVAPGYTHSRPTFNTPLKAIGPGDKPFSDETDNPRNTKATGEVYVGVGDGTVATRIADALRAAAVLCGAMVSPETPSTDSYGGIAR